MRNTPAAITAQTDTGASASFERLSARKVRVGIRYKTPEKRIALKGNDVKAVAVACAAEMDFTRRSLRKLGRQMADLLDYRGHRSKLERSWSDSDERSYERKNGYLTVDSSVYESTE